MAGDERDVQVAGLADRFAVVEALEHCEQPGVLLYLARQGIQVTGASVAGERGPRGERQARSCDCSIRVRLARLRDPGEPCGRGGVDDVEQLAALAVGPAPPESQAQGAAVRRAPLERPAGLFG